MEETYKLNYNSNNFSENISLAHKAVREHEHFTDVILACDDGEINAHRLVLFTGSEFFQKMLPRLKHPNPLIYLKGLKVRDLESILNFVYFGEISLLEKVSPGISSRFLSQCIAQKQPLKKIPFATAKTTTLSANVVCRCIHRVAH